MTLALYLFIYFNPTIFIFITYEIENFDQGDVSSEKKMWYHDDEK